MPWVSKAKGNYAKEILLKKPQLVFSARMGLRDGFFFSITFGLMRRLVLLMRPLSKVIMCKSYRLEFRNGLFYSIRFNLPLTEVQSEKILTRPLDSGRMS